MSDSGFTSVPPRPPPNGQSANSSSSSEPNARLIGLPNEVRAELQTRRAALRVQGEVVRQNDDGSIRVRTERGDIDVRVREGQPEPERGARVELEIQPNRNPERPPEAATLRELSRADVQTPQQRTSATPVDVEVRPQGEAPPALQVLPVELRHPEHTAQEPLPREGEVVRLLPLPARIAQALPLPEFTEVVVTTLPQRAVFQAQLIAENAGAELGKAVLNVPATQTTATQPQVENISSPVLSVSFPAAPVVVLETPQGAPQITQLPPSISVQSAAVAAPVFEPGRAAPQITPELSIPLTPQRPALSILQSVRQNILNPIQHAANLITPKALPLDVLIEKISPPEIRILPPGQTDPPLNQIIKKQTEAPQKQPENLILQNQKAQSLSGVVTNVTADKLPVITAFFPQIGGEQIFALQFPSENITIGTQIQVTPQPSNIALTATTASTPQAAPLPVYIQPQPWPAMEEALQALVRAAPQTAQAMVNVTPSPANPGQLGPAMMFFIAAVRGGDLTQWLGKNATDALRTERGGNSLNKLLGEAPMLSRIAAEPMPQDWRAMNIPLYWDGDMHKIGLYYKHDHEGGSDEQSTLKSTRFVFDLALEHMGKVQLDGLFRAPSDKDGRLDLAVRTEEHFSQATKAEMRRIYAKALRDTQITGELSFQNQPESWVTIQADNNNALGVSA